MSTLTEITFTPEATRALLHRACVASGLDSRAAVLLRHQTNAVYLLESDNLIAKISRPAFNRERLERTLSLTRWLAEQQFPALMPVVTPRPVTVAGCLLTFWPYLSQAGLPPVTAGDLGQPLRDLHALRAPIQLPELDAPTAIRHSIIHSRILTPDQARFLNDRCDALATELPHLNYVYHRGLIHADPQHRNALKTADNTTVIIDWDSASIGQPEWDLVTIEVHCRRFIPEPDEYRRFVGIYGFDIRTWAGYEILRDLRELRMITTNARKSSPGTPEATEVHARIDAAYERDITAPWLRL